MKGVRIFVRAFFEKIVNHQKLIITFFLLMALVSGVCSTMVGVNYDMKDYLPEDSPSSVALDVMEENFDEAIPNARVMIKNVSVPEALTYKERLAACEGVRKVTWLDDATSIETPLAMLDEDTVANYYKDETALFTVTIEEDKTIDAVNAIREVIGDDNAMSGDAVSTAIATQSTVSEIRKIASFAVAFVVVVLCLTMTSWLEPFVILFGIGVAVVINAGTNLIFGEISFVTNAAGNILQLAVSLDYSVFLMHRYEEYHKEFENPKEAMVEALCRSTSSILSSGLTTVISFLALIFMRFGIGPDLGIALAKGVTISLVSAFVFLPALVLTLHCPIDKLRHRSFLPSFEGFSKLCTKVMVPMVVIFVLCVVPSYLALNHNDFYYGSSHIFGEETQIGADKAAIADVFGKSDNYVVLVPRGDTAKEKNLSEELERLHGVDSIISYVDSVGAEIPYSYLDKETLAKLESDDYSRMVVRVRTDYEGEATFQLVDDIRSVTQKYYPNAYYLAGEGVSTEDLRSTITADMKKVNFIAIGAVFVVLLFTMQSISLPVILVMAIETAIWMNLSIPYFAGNNVFYIAYLIISSIQLGATVDYAILFTDRYMEERRNKNRKEAIRVTAGAVTASVLTSGSVLTVVGFLLGNFSTHGILAQLGMFLACGALLSLTIVLFVLPGLLYLFDGVIRHTTRGVHRIKELPQEEA